MKRYSEREGQKRSKRRRRRKRGIFYFSKVGGGTGRSLGGVRKERERLSCEAAGAKQAGRQQKNLFGYVVGISDGEWG